MTELTHKVAVLGIVFQAEQVLLLLRQTPPYVWAPPGGRLNRLENPEAGLCRELREECQIEVEILCPVATWLGLHDQAIVLGLLYLCQFRAGQVQLSAEHSAAQWLSLPELQCKFADQPESYWGEYEYFRRAFAVYQALAHTT